MLLDYYEEEINVDVQVQSVQLTTSDIAITFVANNRSVQRSYQDFVRLCAHLTRKYPGNIIPPLPTAGTMNSDAYCAFLQRVTSHPVFHHDETVALFLSHSMVLKI